jgi:hypothetical protein
VPLSGSPTCSVDEGASGSKAVWRMSIAHATASRRSPITAQGAAVAVTAFAQFGTAMPAARVGLRGYARPVIDGAAQPRMTSLASDDNAAFQQCARAYITSHQASWRNAQHRKQCVRSLETHCYPVIGKLPFESIDTHLVRQVHQPIWNDEPETASRVRGRIEMVLDWARSANTAAATTRRAGKVISNTSCPRRPRGGQAFCRAAASRDRSLCADAARAG